jgi:type II secretory pathway predicted ATPase ExeA
MTKKLQSLYGLKFNPFSPEIPTDNVLSTRRTESFCSRVENLASEGGFALITGDPGTGKSVTLRLLNKRLGAIRELSVGVLSRPQSGVPDMYRELGHLFGAPLKPSNRWESSRVLRQKWSAHMQSALMRPVLLVDEAQEMWAPVLGELRLLCSAELDSRHLLTVVLCGDRRLVERFSEPELLPLGSRIRTRLVTETLSSQELQEHLQHAMAQAGAQGLMTAPLMHTLCEHAMGNLRVLMNMGFELLAAAAEREAPQLDEKLFFDVLAPTPKPKKPQREK